MGGVLGQAIADAREKNCGLATEILDMEKIVNEDWNVRRIFVRIIVLDTRSSVGLNPEPF